jgi:hypothetical protein
VKLKAKSDVRCAKTHQGLGGEGCPPKPLDAVMTGRIADHANRCTISKPASATYPTWPQFLASCDMIATALRIH